jgi:hypothetical protein
MFRYIICLALIITGCSTTYKKPEGIKQLPLNQDVYANFSLKTGKIESVNRSQKREYNSISINLLTDDIVDFGYTWDLYQYCSRSYFGEFEDEGNCREYSGWVTIDKDFEEKGLLLYVLIAPALIMYNGWHFTIDKQYAYDLYKEEKSKLNLSDINKTLASFDNNDKLINELVQETSNKIKELDARLSKKYPLVRKKSIKNDTNFEVTSVIESSCSFIRPERSNSFSQLENHNLDPESDSFQSSLKMEASNVHFGLSRYESSYSISVSGSSKDLQHDGIQYDQDCYIDKDGNAISEILITGLKAKPISKTVQAADGTLLAILDMKKLVLSNTSNKFITINEYAIYNDGEIHTVGPFVRPIKLPPNSMKTISVYKSTKALSIETEHSYLNKKKEKESLGFAISFDIEGQKKSLYRKESPIIDYIVGID